MQKAVFNITNLHEQIEVINVSVQKRLLTGSNNRVIPELIYIDICDIYYDVK